VKRDNRMHVVRGMAQSATDRSTGDVHRRSTDILDEKAWITNTIGRMGLDAVTSLLEEYDNSASSSCERISKICLKYFIDDVMCMEKATKQYEAAIASYMDVYMLKFTEEYYTTDHYEMTSFYNSLTERKATALVEKEKAQLQQTMTRQMQQHMTQQLELERERMRAEITQQLQQQMQQTTRAPMED
jgi:hypothetical protein